MPNGRSYLLYCLLNSQSQEGVLAMTIAPRLTAFSTFCERVLLGETCPNATVPGPRFTDGSTAGVLVGSGMRFWLGSIKMQTKQETSTGRFTMLTAV